MAQKKHQTELKNIPYELFIGALSILSILNIFLLAFTKDPNIENILNILTFVLAFIFLGDFLYRFYTADSRRHYFFREYGWADLLASLPLVHAKILRVFRLFRVYRLMRHLGVKRVLREFFGARGGSALLTIIFIAFLVFEFGGMLILAVERNSPQANIKTASDALWWIMTTVTTVGYGDRFPVTDPGRVIGVFVMLTGIGLFGTLTGFLANVFLTPKEK